MKFWKIYLLVFISSSSFSQPIDLGCISLTLSNKNIQIPIERISLNNNDEITMKAYGHTPEPILSTVILSLTLQKISTDPADLNTKKCWLSLEQTNGVDGCYISFGFDDSYAFYTSQKESMNEVREVYTTKGELFISTIEKQDNFLVIAGGFTSSCYDNQYGFLKSIEIRNGAFTLFIEENKITNDGPEEYTYELENTAQWRPTKYYVDPTTSPCTLSPPYYYIISQPASLLPVEEEPPMEPSPPVPYHIQPPPKDPTPWPEPQPDPRFRSTKTGRGTLFLNPQKTNRSSSARENRQSADTSSTRRTRTRRGGG